MNRSPSLCRPKVRPRFQRAFFRWLQECHGQFATPLRVMRRTDKTIEITFPERYANISVQVCPREMSISVFRDAEWVDFLISIDLALERSSQGYFCKFCELGPRVYFPSREEAWRNHQFEPLLAWINTELAPARWLRIFDSCEISGATLICDEAGLERADPGMRALTGLKRLDGQAMHRPGIDVFEIWDIPMHGVDKEEHYHAVINAK